MTVNLPATMQAAVLREIGSEYSIEEIPVPAPEAGEVLIKVEACGVCHSDLHVARGEVAFPLPAVLGHEISGTIVGLGPDTGTDASTGGFAMGDRVVCGFIMPCTTCERCKAGRDELCTTFYQGNRIEGGLFDGSSRLTDADGNRLNMYSASGFAEYAVAPVSGLTKVPDALELGTAAVLGCAGMTGFGAVTRAAVDVKDQRVCVIAVGGVGLSIVQVLSALGAKQIIAVDVNAEKLELAKRLGATDTVNGLEVDVIETVKQLSEGGVRFAFEALGTPLTLGQAVRVLAEGGRAIAVGLAKGDSEVGVPITALVRRSLELVGSYGARTRQDLPAVVELAATGGFTIEHLVTNRYSLDQINEAYRDLAAGNITGRGIITM